MVFACVFSRICGYCRWSPGILACPDIFFGSYAVFVISCGSLQCPLKHRASRSMHSQVPPEGCFDWPVQHFRRVSRNKGDLFPKGSLGRPLGSLGRLLGGFWGPLGGLLGRLGGLLGCLGEPLGVS